MGWLVGLIVGIIFISLLVSSPGFRITVVVIVCGIGGLIFWKDQADTQEREESLSRIASHEILLQDLSLRNSYSSYNLAGRITNSSKNYAVDWLLLKVKMHDCPTMKQSAKCVTVGEGNVSYSSSIPPGQARDFDQHISFDNTSFKPVGNLVWSYDIESIRGK